MHGVSVRRGIEGKAVDGNDTKSGEPGWRKEVRQFSTFQDTWVRLRIPRLLIDDARTVVGLRLFGRSLVIV